VLILLDLSVSSTLLIFRIVERGFYIEGLLLYTVDDTIEAIAIFRLFHSGTIRLLVGISYSSDLSAIL
jgi:hypothetical protein